MSGVPATRCNYQLNHLRYPRFPVKSPLGRLIYAINRFLCIHQAPKCLTARFRASGWAVQPVKNGTTVSDVRQNLITWRQLHFDETNTLLLMTSNFRLPLRSVAFWLPFFMHELCDNSLIIHPMGSKMLSCLSGTISKHHAKFQSKRFSGCREKR